MFAGISALVLVLDLWASICLLLRSLRSKSGYHQILSFTVWKITYNSLNFVSDLFHRQMVSLSYIMSAKKHCIISFYSADTISYMKTCSKSLFTYFIHIIHILYTHLFPVDLVCFFSPSQFSKCEKKNLLCCYSYPPTIEFVYQYRAQNISYRITVCYSNYPSLLHSFQLL